MYCINCNFYDGSKRSVIYLNLESDDWSEIEYATFFTTLEKAENALKQKKINDKKEYEKENKGKSYEKDSLYFSLRAKIKKIETRYFNTLKNRVIKEIEKDIIENLKKINELNLSIKKYENLIKRNKEDIKNPMHII